MTYSTKHATATIIGVAQTMREHDPQYAKHAETIIAICQRITDAEQRIEDKRAQIAFRAAERRMAKLAKARDAAAAKYAAAVAALNDSTKPMPRAEPEPVPTITVEFEPVIEPGVMDMRTLTTVEPALPAEPEPVTDKHVTLADAAAKLPVLPEYLTQMQRPLRHFGKKKFHKGHRANR